MSNYSLKCIIFSLKIKKFLRFQPAPVPQATGPVSTVPIAAIRHAAAVDAATVKLPPEDYSREITGTRTEQRVKMNRMRLKIAQRLKDAQNTTAMLTTFNEIDMR